MDGFSLKYLTRLNLVTGTALGVAGIFAFGTGVIYVMGGFQFVKGTKPAAFHNRERMLYSAYLNKISALNELNFVNMANEALPYSVDVEVEPIGMLKYIPFRSIDHRLPAQRSPEDALNPESARYMNEKFLNAFYPPIPHNSEPEQVIFSDAARRTEEEYFARLPNAYPYYTPADSNLLVEEEGSSSAASEQEEDSLALELPSTLDDSKQFVDQLTKMIDVTEIDNLVVKDSKKNILHLNISPLDAHEETNIEIEGSYPSGLMWLPEEPTGRKSDLQL